MVWKEREGSNEQAGKESRQLRERDGIGQIRSSTKDFYANLAAAINKASSSFSKYVDSISISQKEYIGQVMIKLQVQFP